MVDSNSDADLHTASAFRPHRSQRPVRSMQECYFNSSIFLEMTVLPERN